MTPLPEPVGTPGDLWEPATDEAERRSSRRRPDCGDGTRGLWLQLNQDLPEHGLEQGDVVASCPTTGVIFVPPFLEAVLAEALWPDEWSLLPPG